MKRSQDEAIKSMQQDENYVVLSNPLASPKFIRMIGKGKELSINDTYTPKIFIEIASKLTPEHLEGLNRSQTIKLEIKIKDFLQDIGANVKNYKHLIDSIEIMQSNLLRWKEGDEVITTAIISKSVHNEKTGKVEIYVDSDISRHILEVKKQSNFHFLKSNIFRLQNAQAIRLYPFFKSWENYPKGYETSLDRFKEQFGYNSKGYNKFSNFDIKVLRPATEEIKEKTDIIVAYEPTGDNLDGLRPRVTGLIFWVTSKEKVKILPTGQVHAKQETAAPQEQAPEPIEATPPQEQPKPAQAVATTNPNEPTTEEITAILSKIDPRITPEQVAVLVEVYSPVRLWEMAKQASIEHKKTPIKNLIGFIKSSADMLGLGLWKKEKEKAKQEQEKAEKAKAEQATKKLLEQITTKYKEDKANYIKAQYEKATEEQKAEAVEMVWNEQSNKRILFQNENKATPNSYGKEKIKELIAFPEGYNERAWIKNYALKTFGIQVDFDQDGQIILASLVNESIEGEPVEVGVFNRERVAAQMPKVAEKIKEPQTPPPPQEQEPEIVPNKSVHEDEQTETPKGIGALLSKFKWK